MKQFSIDPYALNKGNGSFMAWDIWYSEVLEDIKLIYYDRGKILYITPLNHIRMVLDDE